jgi:hydrogenase maturation factor HypF (carbamoyltransferase family)
VIDADVIVMIPRNSQEPAVATLTSPTGEILDAAVVEVSVGTDETTYTWQAAAWVEPVAASTRTARATTLRTWNTPGDFIVHVRLDSKQIIRCTNRIRVP